jgi:hypothetical protein
VKTFALITALALQPHLILVSDAAETAPRFNPLNATYDMGDGKVMLVNGEAASNPGEPGLARRITTKIVGSPARGDLNGDGKADAAVVLMRDPGGSGNFYYIAAAINVNGKAEGTNAVLLGDRISPRTVRIVRGQIMVTYADRNPNDPFTAKPTVPVTKRYMLKGRVLKEVAPTQSSGVWSPNGKFARNARRSPRISPLQTASRRTPAPRPSAPLPHGVRSCDRLRRCGAAEHKRYAVVGGERGSRPGG